MLLKNVLKITQAQMVILQNDTHTPKQITIDGVTYKDDDTTIFVVEDKQVAVNNVDNSFTTTQTISGSDDTSLKLNASNSTLSNIEFRCNDSHVGNIGIKDNVPYFWAASGSGQSNGELVRTTDTSYVRYYPYILNATLADIINTYGYGKYIYDVYLLRITSTHTGYCQVCAWSLYNDYCWYANDISQSTVFSNFISSTSSYLATHLYKHVVGFKTTNNNSTNYMHIYTTSPASITDSDLLTTGGPKRINIKSKTLIIAKLSSYYNPSSESSIFVSCPSFYADEIVVTLGYLYYNNTFNSFGASDISSIVSDTVTRS